eukprot:TRINITY_DN63037_c0_g1_i1.p2 TRINITY_DN63037_c0_g1~~TRINITY_DN63037_c0_g1_i1.p2  ORF type:complete len:344 (+),score=74.79 TRINITY_DN63037_c0_g1_i1:27-1058(+)
MASADPDPAADGRARAESGRHKVQICQFHLAKPGSCPHGERCAYAHFDAELRWHPQNAVRWLGPVGVGELMQRQLGADDHPDSLNIACNRNTALGNPFVNEESTYEQFGASGYCPDCLCYGEEGETCYCLVAENHVELCAAYAEFLDLLLRSAGDELDLPARRLAEDVARRRGRLHVSRRWAWFDFSRRRILRALSALQHHLRARSDTRLLLLCHCGVANASKPCHAFALQKLLVDGDQRLDAAADADACSALERKCSSCFRGLSRGAFDADKMKFHCVVCWGAFVDWIFKKERYFPLPDAPLLQPRFRGSRAPAEAEEAPAEEGIVSKAPAEGGIAVKSADA